MSTRRARNTRRARRATGPLVAGTIALTAILGPGLTSGATLYAEQGLGSLQVTGASIAGPGAGSLRLAPFGSVLPGSSGSRQPVAVTWAPPTTLSMPDSYRVYRRVSGATTWPTEALGAPLTTRFLDESARNCATYDYRVESAYKALRSATAVEATITTDGTAPTIGASYIEAAPAGLAAVRGYVKPGAAFYVYAQVDDDCGLGTGSKLTADLTAFGGSAATPLVAGTFTPGDGSQQFNYKAGPIVAGQLPDGTRGWTVRATDANGNEAQAAGAAAIVDGTGPTAPTAPQAVAAVTDWYAGAHAAIRGHADYRIYAQLQDNGAGVAAGSTADVRNLTTGASAVALAAGSYQAGPVASWTLRSATITTSVAALHDGSTPGFTIQARDVLGNVSSIPGVAYVDEVGPQLTSCSMQSSDAIWGAGDQTSLAFNEPIVPATAVPGWSGVNAVGIGATAVNDTPSDTITFSSTTLLTGGASKYVLGSRDWVTASTGLPGTTLARSSDTGWVITFGDGGANVKIPAERSGASIRLSQSLLDAAGNPLDVRTVPCSIAAGAAPTVLSQAGKGPTAQLSVAAPTEQPVAQDPAPVVEPTSTPVEPAPQPAPVETPAPEPLAPTPTPQDVAVAPTVDPAAPPVQQTSTPEL